jgi:hypothetical protein
VVGVLKTYGVNFQAKELRPVRRELKGRTELNNLSLEVYIYMRVYYTRTHKEVTLLGGTISSEGLPDTRLRYNT